MLKIYGSPNSSAGRCFWCLEEAGVPYEAQAINFREKEHKSAEYLEINPNGKVPALVDDAVKVWDSVAINFYIGDKYKQELIGATVNERAPVRQWSVWALTDLQPPLIDIFIQKKFVPEERRSAEVIKKAEEKMPNLWEVLDKSLENRSYLATNSFTLADLNVASVVDVAYALEMDLSAYSNVLEWMKRVTDRPGYKSYKAKCD